ncbi:MAG: GTPase HflX [Candidatus Bathycorpusculaceae bacterium]
MDIRRLNPTKQERQGKGGSKRTKAIIVQRRQQFEPSSLEELENLTEAAGYIVVGKIEQVREPDSRYQIGAGKVEELAQLVREKGAQKIIFDNPIKPVQSYNLAKATGVEVIDRFQLILEIFSKRATTTEAKMQIQLARLGYELAHAKEKVRLAKKGEQPGFMGLGAYEVDVYYEAVKRQVHTLRKKLKRIRGKRLLHRERRAELGFSSISLAGYTNAGKSSLFNALTEEEVPVDSSLFTTLSTTTRLVKFSKRKFLLTDTVGFIDRLPIPLIEAFHSTLEETIYADLILLVVDLSEPIETVEKKLSVCLETIERIGAAGVPMITALNKIDLLSEKEIQERLEKIKEKTPTPVPISALYKINIETLKQEILKRLENYARFSLTAPLTSKTMPFISWLFNRADVHTIKYGDNSVHVVFEAIPCFAEKIKKHVEEFGGKFEKN